METDVINLINSRFDRLEEKFEIRINKVEAEHVECKARCENKVEMTKIRMTFYTGAIGSICALVTFAISKIFG